MDANRTTPAYELRDDLARLSLLQGKSDPNCRLAWVNSICILFLLIGILGERRGAIFRRPVPPVRIEVLVVVQPAVPPPLAVAPQAEPRPQISPSRVVVALPKAPNIHFSVPTECPLVVPAALAAAPAPPPVPFHLPTLTATGAGGERPEPPYPKLALQSGQQGTVVLWLAGDAVGNITSVEIKVSSGSAMLDRATVDYVKRHWHLPADAHARQFETRITFKLLPN